MQDDVFRPTIRDEAPTGKPPWRPDSIAYPAFFGGPLATAVLGVLNGRRLALPGARLALIAAAGVLGFAIRVAIAASVEGNAAVRFAAAAFGLLVWLVVMAFQRGPFRLLTLRGVEPASLLGPGFLAVLTVGLAENILIVALTR